MGSEIKIIKGAVLDLLVKILLVISVVVVVAIDSVVLRQSILENSLTEYTQTFLIFMCSLVFFQASYKEPESRGFLILVGGFFASMFFRECDDYLDYIFHGFWVYPAVLTAIISITIAARLSGSVKGPMARYFQTDSYTYHSFGLVILLVFSRLFGTGSLWEFIMGGNYSTDYRAAVQEGIELLGYVFVTYGSFLFYKNGLERPKET